MGAFNYQGKTHSTLPLCSAVYGGFYGGRTSISCRVLQGYQPHYQLLLGLYYARENNSCWDKPLRIWKLLLKHNLFHPNWYMSQTECRLLMGFHGIGVGVGSLSRGAIGKVELECHLTFNSLQTQGTQNQEFLSPKKSHYNSKLGETWANHWQSVWAPWYDWYMFLRTINYTNLILRCGGGTSMVSGI